MIKKELTELSRDESWVMEQHIEDAVEDFISLVMKSGVLHELKDLDFDSRKARLDEIRDLVLRRRAAGVPVRKWSDTWVSEKA